MNRNFFLSRIEVRKVNLICNNLNFFYNIKIFIFIFLWGNKVLVYEFYNKIFWYVELKKVWIYDNDLF